MVSYYAIPGLDRMNQVVHLNMDMVVNLVCEKMGISREVINIKTRQKEILIPRQITMAFTREFVPYLTLEYIGKHLGGKDHATVIHACKIVRDVWMNHKKYGPVVKDIHDTLKEMKRQRKLLVVGTN